MSFCENRVMEKIYLKATELSDYDEYYKIRCSPSDIYWNGYYDKPDRNKFKELFINRIASSPFEKPEDRNLFLIGLRQAESDDLFVGFVQLIRRENGVEIGYSVVEEYQNRGIATIALKQAVSIAQNYSKNIFVRIRDDNILSQKVALKNGFIKSNEFEILDYPKAGKVALRTYYKSNNI